MKPIRRVGILAVAVLTALTSGCWDAHEIDTLSIVTGIGIDTAANPEDITLVIQMGKVGSKEEAKADDRPYVIKDIVSHDVLFATDTLKHENSRSIFLQHNQAVIFGIDQAKKGINPHLDAFLRNSGTRMEVWVMVGRQTAKDILSVQLEQDKNPALALSKMMDNEQKMSAMLGTSLLCLASNLVDETTAPVMPIISTIWEDDRQKLLVDGLAVFREDKMVGSLSQEEAHYYAWLKDSMKDCVMEINLENGDIMLILNHGGTTWEPVLLPDGNMRIDAKVTGEFSIGEIQGFEGMSMAELMPLAEQSARETVEENMMAVFESSKAMNADIFSVGTAVHRKYKEQWSQMKDKWDELYPNITLHITTEITVKDAGKIFDGITMREEVS